MVGKGTYIRALARDLAAALGTLGHVAALRRLSVGPFTEAQAISLESWAIAGILLAVCGHLLPIETALDGIPALALTEAEAVRLRCGQRVPLSDPGGQAARPSSKRARWSAPGMIGVLVALARIEDGGLRPLRVINC